MGAKANTSEQTPPETTPENVEDLLEAARFDDIDDIISLASVGVSLDSKDSQGQTELMTERTRAVVLAVTEEENSLSRGVSCDRGGKFVIPLYALHMASANGHLDIVNYLISNGVDVNAFNAEKNTPLHWACLNGQIEVVKSLIIKGASVSALNSQERTPMDEAVSRGNMDVIDAINTAVAQVELAGTSVS